MATIQVTIPESLEPYLGQQLATGRFTDVSDYVSQLIRGDQEFRNRVDQLLLEGLASGPAVDVDEAWWESRRAAIESR